MSRIIQDALAPGDTIDATDLNTRFTAYSQAGALDLANHAASSIDLPQVRGRSLIPLNSRFLWMDLGTTPRTGFAEGWIAFTPYLITVLVVMATAWYQQAQTTAKSKNGQPAAQQPGQAILKIFPVFFGFISFTLPAGLVVYFAASNIFRIGQQSLILWLDKRSKRKAGAGSDGAVAPVEVEPQVEPEPERKPSQAGGSGKPARKPGTGGSSRSPHASRQRGKKRRRR